MVVVVVVVVVVVLGGTLFQQQCPYFGEIVSLSNLYELGFAKRSDYFSIQISTFSFALRMGEES